MAQSELVYVFHCNIQGYHVYKEILGSIYRRDVVLHEEFCGCHAIREIHENFVPQKFPLYGISVN